MRTRLEAVTYIGVRLQALTPQLAKEINATSQTCRVPETNGVLVIEVVENSPASRAGIRACDLITAVNGKRVKEPSDVQLGVDRGKVGEDLPLTVQRNGSSKELTVRPAELPRKG